MPLTKNPPSTPPKKANLYQKSKLESKPMSKYQKFRLSKLVSSGRKIEPFLETIKQRRIGPTSLKVSSS